MKETLETVVPWVNFLLAASVGVLVLRWIFRRTRKRVVGEPQCPRCRYVVVGLTGTVCPECGNDLEASGVIPADGRRGDVYLRWGLLWTAGVMALATWLSPKLYRGFVLVSDERHGCLMLVRGHEQAEQLWLEAHGVGYGGRAPIQELELLPSRENSGFPHVVWKAKSSGADRLTPSQLTTWVKEMGVDESRAEAVSGELMGVIIESSHLPAVMDLRLITRSSMVGGHWRQETTTVEGTKLQHLVSTQSGSEWEGDWLFTDASWIFAGFVVLWLTGLRLWVRRRVIVDPLWKYRMKPAGPVREPRDRVLR